MFFFFNDTATTEIYTLSLHDALPISERAQGLPRADPAVARRAARVPDRGRRAGLRGRRDAVRAGPRGDHRPRRPPGDRKSTRLNSSHANISYAVFCLKKKKNTRILHT